MPEQPVAGSEFLSSAKQFLRGLMGWIAEEEGEGEHPGTPVDSSPRQASGVAFVAPDGKALFMRRANDRDAPGTWAFPAGMREGDETPDATASREAAEETGIDCGKMYPIDRRTINDVDFSTYLHPIEAPFEPHLTPEHTEYQWAEPLKPPSPLHPGVRATLDQIKPWEGATDPPVSEAQRRAMWAAKSGHSNIGIPSKVGKEFASADPGGKLPEKKGHDSDPAQSFQLVDKRTGQAFNVDPEMTRILTAKNALTDDVKVPKVNPPDVDPPKSYVTGRYPPRPPSSRDTEMPSNYTTGRYSPVNRDAGTSEGARKAAQTRKAGGGTKQEPYREQRQRFQGERGPKNAAAVVRAGIGKEIQNKTPRGKGFEADVFLMSARNAVKHWKPGTPERAKAEARLKVAEENSRKAWAAANRK